MSAPRDEHPKYPGMRVLVAGAMEEYFSMKKDMMVEYFMPSCPACKMTFMVFRRLAQVLSQEAGNEVIFGMMDATRNYRKGLTPKDDWEAFPQLIIYKAGSREPISFERQRGRPLFDQIIDFAYANLSIPFDKETIRAKMVELLPEIEKEYQGTLQDAVSKEAYYQLYQLAPCGKERLQQAFSNMLGILIPVPQDRLEAGYKALDGCERNLHDSRVRFWTSVLEEADQNLSAFGDAAATAAAEAGGEAAGTGEKQKPASSTTTKAQEKPKAAAQKK